MKARFWFLAALASLASAPAAAQKPLDQPGTVSHSRADAHFAEQVGEFRRTSVVQYDEDGHDISASYGGASRRPASDRLRLSGGRSRRQRGRLLQ